MTPEERAAEVVDIGNEFGVSGDGDKHLKAAIATAIRAAVAEAVERCAKVAEARAVFHRDNCLKSCACADGWHIAMSIRATGTGAAGGGE